MITEISFRGEFAIWSYTIGHGRLLLRRTKSSEYPSRVDILLKDVGWISMPTAFTDVVIREARLGEMEGVLVAAGSPRESGRKMFALSGSGWQGFVLAAVVTWHEDQGEYNDPSPLLE